MLPAATDTGPVGGQEVLPGPLPGWHSCRLLCALCLDSTLASTGKGTGKPLLCQPQSHLRSWPRTHPLLWLTVRTSVPIKNKLLPYPSRYVFNARPHYNNRITKLPTLFLLCGQFSLTHPPYVTLVYTLICVGGLLWLVKFTNILVHF